MRASFSPPGPVWKYAIARRCGPGERMRFRRRACAQRARPSRTACSGAQRDVIWSSRHGRALSVDAARPFDVELSKRLVRSMSGSVGEMVCVLGLEALGDAVPLSPLLRTPYSGRHARPPDRGARERHRARDRARRSVRRGRQQQRLRHDARRRDRRGARERAHRAQLGGALGARGRRRRRARALGRLLRSRRRDLALARGYPTRSGRARRGPALRCARRARAARGSRGARGRRGHLRREHARRTRHHERRAAGAGAARVAARLRDRRHRRRGGPARGDHRPRSAHARRALGRGGRRSRDRAPFR